MRLKFLSFSNITLLVALSLSSVAAWYSIIGLTAIFAGAVIPVIIMGGILEIGKITTTVWLRKYWHRAGWLLKLYLVPAVIALALLTSMGIFGFLSKAHMDQGITSGDSQAKLSLYDEKIKTQRDNIELARKALTQMDNQVDQRLSRGDSENSAERAVQIRRQQAGERTKLQKEIGDAQKEIAKLNEERAPIAAENRKIEAEVGPIKYIAALIYGDNADNNTLEAAVRWVIILLVIVFDPLAIALVLAANASREWDDEEGDSPLGTEPISTPTVTEPEYESDDGPLIQEQIDQIKQSVNDIEVTPEEDEAFKELEPKGSDPTIHCYKCGTELVNAPGIGNFCPNKECDVIDNTKGVAWTYVPPEPEKSLLEKNPYLTAGFKHFENLTPMVYKPEVIVEPTVDAVVTADNIEIVTDGVTVEKRAPEKLYKESEGDYVLYDGKSIQIDALKSLHPELFRLSPDATGVSTGFGIKFPDQSKKGDVFTRVDVLPNRVFKFDGARWIEVNKNQSDTYLHDQKYIQYLVDKLEKGEYDVELLSDNERVQIEQHLQNQKS
jgi:hypothetical protein